MFKHPLLYVWIGLAGMIGVAVWVPNKEPIGSVEFSKEAGKGSGETSRSNRFNQRRPAIDDQTSPKNHKADCSKKEEADLCAQQRMAAAAESQAADTRLSVILLFLTFGAAAWAVWEARKAAKAATDGASAAEITNRIVARSAALELRAYLSVLPGGINQLIRSHFAMGHVLVRNVGKLPARNVWVEVSMRIDDRDDLGGASLRDDVMYSVSVDPKEFDPNFSVDRAIQPGTEMRQGSAEKDEIHILDIENQPPRHIYVWGVAYYDDGSKRRFTRFRHRYAIASRVRRDDWGHLSDTTREIITVDKARFHPFGNSAN
jgi:hypothetical protein